MEELINLFASDFEIRGGLKTKEKWMQPGDITLSNGQRITTLSNGHYMCNDIECRNVRGLHKVLKTLTTKDVFKLIKQEIPKVKTFQINAGYKWFNRPDLFEDDCMKECGTRAQLPIINFILMHKGWEKLNVPGLSREPDILLINRDLKIVLYFEMKLCPVLDTTNGPGTIEKIDILTAELQAMFLDMNIVSGLFCPCLREATKIKDIAPGIASKKPEFKERELLGFNTLMDILGRPHLNDADFIKTGSEIGKTIKTDGKAI